MWSSGHSAIYCSLHLHLAIANDQSLAIGITRIDQKVMIMQLGYQFDSYNLMHIQES
jgi:RES domain-containing protein